MYLVNFLDSLSTSDTIFYILIFLLTVISLILVFLIYSQNKEMSKQLKEKSLFADEDLPKQEDTTSTVLEVENLVPAKPEIVPVTDMEIPNLLELTQSFNTVSETDELQSITRELETLPREKTIKMTPYEAEQEETAIISYDELIKHSEEKNTNVSYENMLLEEKSHKSELVGENKKVESSEDKVIINEKYDHEENYLSSLKTLLNMLKE